MPEVAFQAQGDERRSNCPKPSFALCGTTRGWTQWRQLGTASYRCRAMQQPAFDAGDAAVGVPGKAC
jgi:hypothetical protein